MIGKIIKLALTNIRNHLLRTVLTLVIIALGITALVGILTAIDSAIFSLSDNFSSLGANSFSISPKNVGHNARQDGVAEKRSDPISFKQAMEFKEKYGRTSRVAFSFGATGSAKLKYKENETNPTVTVRGVDENELYVRSRDMETGRFFSELEILNGEPKTVIGSELVDLLFESNPEEAIGKVILISGNRYKVIGTLESQGSAMNSSSDRLAFIPVTKAKTLYS